MIRNSISMVFAIAALAGCSEAPAQDKPAAAAESQPNAVAAPASSLADDEAAVRAAALAFYNGYAGGGLANDLPKLTPEFEAAWDRAVGGPESALDFDPFCDCQDPDGLTGARIDSVELAGDTATVNLSLMWPDSSPQKKMIFKRIGGNWLLDDLSSGDWTSLHRAMAADEPGSWGIG